MTLVRFNDDFELRNVNFEGVRNKHADEAHICKSYSATIYTFRQYNVSLRSKASANESPNYVTHITFGENGMGNELRVKKRNFVHSENTHNTFI